MKKKFPSNLRWLQDAMAIIASETFSSCSAPIQYAATAAFENYYGDEMQKYLSVSKRVLNALAIRAYDSLSAIDGCYVNKSQGAFYVFPDFTNVPGLKELIGGADSEALSKYLINECGVAGLGGYCFGRPIEELTMKFSFVDFDGQTIFDDLDNMPANIHSSEMDAFVRKHCPNTVEGFEIMRDFMNELAAKHKQQYNAK
jgi:aspartate aminotransferase